MSETNVNAYRLELQEAEKLLAQTQGRVDELKAKIQELDPSSEPQPDPEDPEETPDKDSNIGKKVPIPVKSSKK